MGLWSLRRKWTDQSCLYSLYLEHLSPLALHRWVLIHTKFIVTEAEERMMVNAQSKLRQMLAVQRVQWIGESKNEWAERNVISTSCIWLCEEEYMYHCTMLSRYDCHTGLASLPTPVLCENNWFYQHVTNQNDQKEGSLQWRTSKLLVCCESLRNVESM